MLTRSHVTLDTLKQRMQAVHRRAETVDGADGAHAAVAPGVETGRVAMAEPDLVRTQFVEPFEV
jgi:hypothetical protein